MLASIIAAVLTLALSAPCTANGDAAAARTIADDSTVPGVGTGDDAAMCLSVVNAVQGDFKAMLGQPDPTTRLKLAERLAARFTADGVMADPAWRPNSGHDTIAKAETAT